MVDGVLTESLGQRLPVVVGHIGDHHAGALGHEQLGLGRALPLRSTGDDGDLAVQPSHVHCST
jgi:hypothetical protein